MSTDRMTPLLRDGCAGLRAGLTFFVLTILLGLWSSAKHLELHHENRDGIAGLTLDDLRGVYHGIQSRAPLLTALESGHPEELAEGDRKALLDWLRSDDLSSAYDDLELGDAAPAEILQRACVTCHARGADDPDGTGIGQKVPLEFWDDVERLAVSREITPNPPEVVFASAHTHTLAMASLSLVLAGLLCMTRWSRKIVNTLVCATGAALLADIGSWWLARGTEAFVLLIATAGTVYLVSSVLTCLLVLIDLWRPREAT